MGSDLARLPMVLFCPCFKTTENKQKNFLLSTYFVKDLLTIDFQLDLDLYVPNLCVPDYYTQDLWMVLSQL